MPLKAWLSLAASAAINGALGYLATQLGNGLPSSAQQWTAALVGVAFGALVAVVHLYQTSPPDFAKMKALRAAGKALACLFVLGALGGSVTACPPPSNAPGASVLSQLEADVLNALKSHASLTALEALVAMYVPAGADVDLVLNDVLTFLHDANLIPPDVLPIADVRRAELGAKIAAKRNPPAPVP